MPLNQGQRNTIWQEFINESKKTREEVLRNGVVYEASDVFKYLKASINGELKQGQKSFDDVFENTQFGNTLLPEANKRG